MCSHLCCLHTAIHISSLCGFWHCHPYIPIHFWKMFFILVCVRFCCTTLPYRRLSLSKFSTNTFSMHVSVFVEKGLNCPSNLDIKLGSQYQWLPSTTRRIIRESVDSLCRDGADTPIVRVHRKAFLTRERSRSKPFWAPSYSIPVVRYPTIPPK